MNEPVLPYAGTSGYSGTDTSEARARETDRSGITGQRQKETISWLSRSGNAGLTVLDLRKFTGWHHGQASAALSNLHKEGVIDRLDEVRTGCKVYVLPEYVHGREVEGFGRRGTSMTTQVSTLALQQLKAVVEVWASEDTTNHSLALAAERFIDTVYGNE